jgi:predicted glycoside hydrolase/deacetylase ChbG (UPF0249 family)
MRQDSLTQTASIRIKHPIAICADDFGIEPGVDEAIVELCQKSRLSATSCLTMAPYFAEHAVRLKSLDVDIGLHVNFTESLGRQGLFLPLSNLIARSYLRQLPGPQVRQQIEGQFDAFEQHMGRAPDFVDGHLHVHQLPVIREVLVKVLSERYPDNMPWIRNTQPGKLSNGLPWMQRLKAHVIGALGARSLSRSALQIGARINRDFFGAYDFSRPHPPYAAMLDAWLQHTSYGSLIMTHPAKYVSAKDAFGQDRIEEYRVLGSEVFLALLEQHSLEVRRLSALRV